MGKVREFITYSDDLAEKIWLERNEESLIGTVRGGKRPMPRIRPFDLLLETNPNGVSRVTIWEGEILRIAVEKVRGREKEFTRAADYDLIFLQYCAVSTIESEYGQITLEPGEMVLMPAGICHRSVGKGECLRLRVMVQECVQLGVDPNKPATETKFSVSHSGSLAWSDGDDLIFDEDLTLEHMSFWNPESDVWIERKSQELIGSVLEGGRGLNKIRAFDYFTGMTGKGVVAHPVLYQSSRFRIDVHNLEGLQRGFHRGCFEDEISLQFRGRAAIDSEWGISEQDPGEMSYVPRGIAHRINAGKGSLRMVFYSKPLVYPKTFQSFPGRHTTFSIE